VTTVSGLMGKEKDNEVKGEGNSYDFGARNYDPRIARFITLDPKMSEYSSMSPYCFAANNPIKLVDVNGEGPGDETKNLVIPTAPDKVDTKVWTAVEEGKGAERGHTKRWTNKEGQMLAFDKGKGGTGASAVDNWHVYNKDGKRLQANGELAGGVKDGKPFYNKNAVNAHFKSGQATQIKIKVPSAGAVIKNVSKVAKVANKVLVPVAIATSVYDIATADNKPREAVKQASGWAGAWAVGEAGATIGAGIGVWFGGVGAVPGAAIGGFIGSIGGYFAGSEVGEAVYDKATEKK
jgi:RHS repeat-associated protein